jgi:GntR family histidine utilization transcriptional repressor
MILFRSGPPGPNRRRFDGFRDAPVPSGPAYQRIKGWIMAQIVAGVWKPGDAVPSEASLAAQFGVSRMTANRAVRELRDEGVVVRVQGSGTFVARGKHETTVVSIRSIDEEIRSRGYTHRGQLQRLERCEADAELAELFALPEGSPLYRSVVVHFGDEEPIQVEDRHVNPSVAPDYIAADFSRQTPSAYLLREVPLEGVQFSIEASPAPTEVARLLRMPVGDPALVLTRRTTSRGQVASVAIMWHPAARYQFTGSF